MDSFIRSRFPAPNYRFIAVLVRGIDSTAYVVWCHVAWLTITALIKEIVGMENKDYMHNLLYKSQYLYQLCLL